MDLSYNPSVISSLYNSTSFTLKVVKEKTGFPFSRKRLAPLVKAYEIGQKAFLIDKVKAQLQNITKTKPFLSSICHCHMHFSH